MDNETPDMGKLEKYHWSKLPVWSKGNVYLNGAKAWKHEENGVVDTEDTAVVDLAETDGRPVLKTNLPEILTKLAGQYKDGIVTSDVLGKAFQPEERYENPDGTAIIFDKDYFGGHRGITPIAGPFADAAAFGKPLWNNK